ncbi:MAG TPA: AP2 domain-containing protein [Vicinamibacteria bacterium]|jgi:hypothetical protein|nr:AP2 domain-containing protein [Vicinamibacteria bacterium]
MTRHSNLRRYEYHRFRGWIVTAMRRGRYHARYFRDGTTGRAVSFLKALAYRDRLLSRLPPVIKTKRRHVLSKTGVVGVTVGVERIRSGNRVRRYRANWPALKGRAFKSFSVAKYGEREARRLAKEARARGLEQFVSERTRLAAAAVSHH